VYASAHGGMLGTSKLYPHLPTYPSWRTYLAGACQCRIMYSFSSRVKTVASGVKGMRIELNEKGIEIGSTRSVGRLHEPQVCGVRWEYLFRRSVDASIWASHHRGSRLIEDVGSSESSKVILGSTAITDLG